MYALIMYVYSLTIYTRKHVAKQSFHETIEHVAGKWVRRNRAMPEPELGATLPVRAIY